MNNDYVFYSHFTAASIIPTNAFGTARNFSLFNNITCTGMESTISQCTVHTSECTPWCALSNIGITCFSKLKSLTIHNNVVI